MGKLGDLINSQPEIRRNVLRRVRQVVVVYILIALLLFVPAGSLRWPYAWLYLAVYLLVMLVGVLVLPLDLISERGSRKENAEKWDVSVSRLMAVFTVGIYPLAGLDFRWHWSPELATGLHVASITAFILGCALEVWAMASNRFFSTSVRIQSDRGHTVCSSGPYRYVRHPGYVGMIICFLATPVFVGSLWGVIPAMATAVLFVVRTRMEDRTLLQKLLGYREYAARVRFRLFPGVW